MHYCATSMTFFPAAMERVWLSLTYALICQCSILVRPHTWLKCDPTQPTLTGCLRGQDCLPSGLCQSDFDRNRSDAHLPPCSPDSVSGIEILGEAHNGSFLSLNDPNIDRASAALGNFGGEHSMGRAPRISSRQQEEDSEPADPGFDMDDEGEGSIVSTDSESLFPPLKDKTEPIQASSHVLCGPENEYARCDNSSYGPCCSAYGFCGDGLSFCGYGCQSGKCLDGGEALVFPFRKPQTRRLLGHFEVVGQSGVPAMSTGLMFNGRVIFIDKVENYTQLILENGHYAYSAEYDPSTRTSIGLSYKTNAFCSGGAFLADGRMVSIGGNGPLDFDPTVGDGFRGLRYLRRSLFSKDNIGDNWSEPGHMLSTPRWYASVQVLRDGRVFVASGSINGLDPLNPNNNNPTYEMLNRDGMPTGLSTKLPILERNQPYYMYPFLHLLKNGDVFVFVSRSAEIFDVYQDRTVQHLPDLPGDYRTYPNTGGSVLLPLKSDNNWDPEIIVCGGGAYQGVTSPTDPTCGRIKPLAPDPIWELEAMPEGRGMLDGILLPDGKVVWLNGCRSGSQGFRLAKDPIYEAWIYDPELPRGARWALGGSSKVPRLYHSVAVLLLDGTVLVAGSNPVEQPILQSGHNNHTESYVTEFRVEIYTPPYLTGDNIHKRPKDVWISERHLTSNKPRFLISFSIHSYVNTVRVALYHGGFVTHSLHMGQRLIYLDADGFDPRSLHQALRVTMPPSSGVAPPGPYVLYVVVDGIPSIGQFVMVE